MDDLVMTSDSVDLLGIGDRGDSQDRTGSMPGHPGSMHASRPSGAAGTPPPAPPESAQQTRNSLVQNRGSARGGALAATLAGRPLRIFSGTWNVRGRPNALGDGSFEHISPEAVAPWLSGAFPKDDDGGGGGGGGAVPGGSGAARPDLLFFALEEVMDLSPVNVVVDSFQPSEDHYARVKCWRDAIAGALDLLTAPKPAGSCYSWLGQSTQVGLVLLVFGSPVVAQCLREVEMAHVKTGWGGMLGNKGSCMWRARLGDQGPTICAVASHFASGREKVEDRNHCYDMAVGAKVFDAKHKNTTSTAAAGAGGGEEGGRRGGKAGRWREG